MTSNGSAAPRTAAFYDVDGTLIKTNVVHAYAYYAVNAPSMTDRVRRTAGLMASLPLYWMADKYDRKLFNDAFYKNYKGFGEDRLVILGEEIFERVIKPNILDGAQDLVARSKSRGIHQVLVTGAIDHVTKPLAEFLGVDHWVANTLEMKDRVATGRLVEPIMAGANKALWVRRYAEANGYALDDCYAYADSGSDLPMLSVVGRPCAVNPDFRLRTTAKAYQWPVLELG